MNKPELKSIIANSDLDVQIVRKDNATILEVLQSEGYSVLPEEVVTATEELRADAYYSRLIAQGFAQ